MANRQGFLAAKVEGGGSVKAFPRCAEGAPGGAEAHEGRGSVEAQPVSTDTALEAGSKALEARARSLVTGVRVQRQEGMNRPGKPGTAPQRGTNP
jgi:hypothetical protein